MVYSLTKEQRQLIIKMKKKAEHDDYCEEYPRKRRHDISKLSEAFMTYIDIIGVEKYKPKNLNTAQEINGFKECVFTPGELGKITTYLRKKDLIDVDEWGRYVVKWRKNDREMNMKKNLLKECITGNQTEADSK